MEHILPSSLERIIWRYLRNEERLFLELIFPGEIFTENVESKEGKHNKAQEVANFAAATNWLAALDYLRPHVDLNKALVAAVIGGCDNAIGWLEKQGAAHSDQTIKYAAAANRHEYLERMSKQIDAKSWEDFASATANALKAAAKNGNLKSIAVLLPWRNDKLPKHHAKQALLGELLTLAAESGNTDAISAVEVFAGEIISVEGYVDALLCSIKHKKIEIVRWLRTHCGMGMPFSWEGVGGHRIYLFKDAVREIAQSDHLEMLTEMRGWLRPLEIKRSEVLAWAAESGDRKSDAMRVVKSWEDEGNRYFSSDPNTLDYGPALECAARAGNIENMKLLKEWNSQPFTEQEVKVASTRAAEEGNIIALELLRSWRVHDYHEAFVGAAFYAQTDTMRLLRQWGANNYDEALGWAAVVADASYIPALTLLKDWGATNFAEALREARQKRNDDDSIEPCEEIIELLKSWMAAE